MGELVLREKMTKDERDRVRAHRLIAKPLSKKQYQSLEGQAYFKFDREACVGGRDITPATTLRTEKIALPLPVLCPRRDRVREPHRASGGLVAGDWRFCDAMCQPASRHRACG